MQHCDSLVSFKLGFNSQTFIEKYPHLRNVLCARGEAKANSERRGENERMEKEKEKQQQQQQRIRPIIPYGSYDIKEYCVSQLIKVHTVWNFLVYTLACNQKL